MHLNLRFLPAGNVLSNTGISTGLLEEMELYISILKFCKNISCKCKCGAMFKVYATIEGVPLLLTDGRD